MKEQDCMQEEVVHWECDYCGGYDEIRYVPEGQLTIPYQSASLMVVRLNKGNGEYVEWNICDRCWIKVFDTVLGGRKK